MHLTRSNRATGLMNEIDALIDDEVSAIELWRIQKSLQALMEKARNKVHGIETATHEIEKAGRKQQADRKTKMSARIAALAARC